MRALRALLIGLATLLAIALLTVWLAPRYLDWNRYRDEIARVAATALDRPVLIEGPITLSVLPRPELTAFGVSVAGNPDEGTFSARELSLSVALVPLMAGRLEARELVLRGVDVHVPWPVPNEAMPARRPNWLAGMSARIEDGSITVGSTTLSDVDAALTAGGPLGGYRLAGAARFHDRPWRFTARLTSPGPDGASGFDATVDGEGPAQGLAAAFSGQVSPGGAGGRFTAHGPDLGQMLPAPPMPFSAEGRLAVVGGVARVEDIALQLGDARASGAISLSLSPSLRLDLAVAASRLDFDAWLKVLLQGGGVSYPVGLDLSAEAAQLSGGLLRDLRARFEVTGTAVEVRAASAILPGEASLRLAGTITRPAAGQPRFAGKLALSAPDLRATLRWLDPPGTDALGLLPAGVLRAADFSAEVVADANRLALADVSGTVDASRVSGSLSLARGPRQEPQRVALRADLRLDRLELDAWLPASQPLPRGLPRLSPPVDIDLKLQAAQGAFRGVAISGLALDAAAAGGRLNIRRLEGEAQGVRASLSGAIDANGRVATGRLDLATVDASPLARLLPPAWPANPALWHAPLRAEVEADGPPGALRLRARLALGEAQIETQSTLDVPGRRWSGSLGLRHPAAARLLQTLGFAGAGNWLGDGPLAVAADIAAAPERIGADKIQLTAGLLRAGGQLALDLSGEQPRLSGHVTAAALPLPALDLTTPAPLPLDALHGWQGAVEVSAAEVLAGRAGAKRPVLRDAAAKATLDGATLRLDGVTATLAGGAGTLTGSIGLDAAAEPPSLAIEAALAGAEIAGPVTGLPLDIVAGRADGNAKLTANGHSPAALLATLDGEIRIAVRDGRLSGLDLGAIDAALRATATAAATDAALKGAMASGTTGFEQFEIAAKATRGIMVLGEAVLGGPSGKATFSGSVDFPDHSLDLRAELSPAVPDAPRIGVRLTGPFEVPRRLPELADVTRWRAQHSATP